MKWYAYVIIALLLVALGFSIRGCRQAEHDEQVTNLAAIDLMVEHKQEIDSMEAIIARQAHEKDSVPQHHAQTQAPVKANVTKWKEHIDPVERIAVLINWKKEGDTRPDSEACHIPIHFETSTVYFTSKEEALRYLYDQIVARDTTIYWQDSLIRDMDTERASTKVSTDALISTLESKSRLSEDEVSKWIGMWQASEAGRMADEKAWKRQRRWERVLEIGGVVLIGIIAL